MVEKDNTDVFGDIVLIDDMYKCSHIHGIVDVNFIKTVNGTLVLNNLVPKKLYFNAITYNFRGIQTELWQVVLVSICSSSIIIIYVGYIIHVLASLELVMVISLTVCTPFILSKSINRSLKNIGWFNCHLSISKWDFNSSTHLIKTSLLLYSGSTIISKLSAILIIKASLISILSPIIRYWDK